MGEKLDKLKGRIKRAQSAMTGELKEAEGALDEAKGKVKEKIEELREDIKRPPR
jgi:uncharacterized protein YjbJ (UPF0337 family)